MIPIPEYHANSAKLRYSDTRGKKWKKTELVNVDHPLDQTDETTQDSPVEPFEQLRIPRFSGVNLGRSNLAQPPKKTDGLPVENGVFFPQQAIKLC